MLVVNQLTKAFKHKTIVSQWDYTFEAGKIYGLVGYNGSGKTVLLRCLSGLDFPTSGTITYQGQEIGKDVEFLPNVGVIIESPGFLEQYTGFQNLKQVALLKGKVSDERIRQEMKVLQLEVDNDRAVKHYSLGMKQKLGLIQAFMEDPEILLLDEPLNGLDKNSVALVQARLQAFKERGAIIILAIHNIYGIRDWCDEVIDLEEIQGAQTL